MSAEERWKPIDSRSRHRDELLRVLDFIYQTGPRTLEQTADRRMEAVAYVATALHIERETVRSKYIVQLGLNGPGATSRFDALVFRWLTTGGSELENLLLEHGPEDDDEEQQQEVGYFFSLHPTPLDRSLGNSAFNSVPPVLVPATNSAPSKDAGPSTPPSPAGAGAAPHRRDVANLGGRTTRKTSAAPKAPHDDNGLRRQGREAAVQVLYAIDAAGEQNEGFVDDALRAYWSHLEGPAPGRPYGDALVRGVVAKGGDIDPMIRAANPNWRLERMARVDRNVLRMAAWEMVYGDVPPEVAIDEAIEMAKRFGTEDSAAFVNGTLDKLATLQGKLAPRANEGVAKKG